eukprot:CAMPEP_0204574296 /NCGR_PEP_ID=MMETSP0661-20131031/40522_1 /ASSEMBLY_ACC=CAM_ASM_000606 /TAXON_ID=109239 /ORGANISM="Alexandrium margalefi, Strain AMGDE01CS-322" /LENGTH=32 /DNA_ID= /DNA_START= /DNA_END= /DNA_ORIENTATION=
MSVEVQRGNAMQKGGSAKVPPCGILSHEARGD